MTRQLVRALKAAQAKLKSFGQSAMATGRQVAFVGLAMAAPFAFATRTFAEFDDQMRTVKVVTKDIGDAFETLTEQAKTLGRTTSFTAIQVAQAMVQLGRATFIAGETEKAIPHVLDLARATGTDLAEAAEIAAVTLRQFKLDASQMERVVDVMTATANNSVQTLSDLGQSMVFGAQIATKYGLEIEEVSEMLGILATQGLKGTIGGTALRKIMLELANPDVQKQLRANLVEPLDDLKELKSPLVILRELGVAMADMTNPQQLALLRDMFDIRAVGASAEFTAESLLGLQEAIANSSGATRKAAAEMDAGLGGAFRILKSAIEGVKIEIGGALAPALQKLSKFMTTTAQDAIKWIKANKGMVVSAALATAGIIALGVALMAAGGAALAASFALGGLVAIATAFTSPIGLITIAVVGATVAFFRWTEAGQTAFRSLSSTLGKMLNRFREVFGGIGDAISSGDFALAFDIMKAAASLAFAEVAARAKWVFMTLIPGLASAVFQGLTGGFGAVVEGWKGPALAFWEFYKTVAMAWFGFVGDAFKSLLRAWGDGFSSLWKLFGNIAGIAFDLVVATWRARMQAVVDIAQAFWKAFKGFGLAAVQSVVAGFITAFVAVPGFILKSLFSAFLQSAEFLLKSLVGAVTLWAKFTAGVAGTVATLIRDALKGKVPGLKAGVQAIDTGASAAMGGLKAVNDLKVAGVTAALESQASIASAALEGLTGEFGDFAQVAKDFGADVATAVAKDVAGEASALKNAKDQMVSAVNAFAGDLSQAALDHAGRIKDAGLDAAKVIAPAARRLAEATKGMSEEVKAAFLERFQAAFAGIKDFKDPKAVTALRERLASLIAEATEAKGAAVGAGAGGGAGGVGVAGGAGGVAAALAAPRGIALTATHSAAAARISGFQPGASGPEEKLANGVEGVNDTTKQILNAIVPMAGWLSGNPNIQAVLERFLAGWKVT